MNFVLLRLVSANVLWSKGDAGIGQEAVFWQRDWGSLCETGDLWISDLPKAPHSFCPVGAERQREAIYKGQVLNQDDLLFPICVLGPSVVREGGWC